MDKRTRNIVLGVASVALLVGIVTTTIVIAKARKERKAKEKT